MNLKKTVDSGENDFLAVAKITACFGVKGKLKIQLFSKDDLHLDGIKDVRIGYEEKDAVAAELITVEYQPKSVIISLEGIVDRNGAEPLIGKLIFIDRKSISPPKEGRYYIHDIIGCEVFSPDGGFLGRITDVVKLPSHDLWEVGSGQKSFYIPVVKEIVRRVDLENRKVIIDPIEGLID